MNRVGKALEAKKFQDAGNAWKKPAYLELEINGEVLYYIKVEDVKDLLTNPHRQKIPIFKKIQIN